MQLISKQGRDALTSLRKDETIVILPADKGRITVAEITTSNKAKTMVDITAKHSQYLRELVVDPNKCTVRWAKARAQVVLSEDLFKAVAKYQDLREDIRKHTELLSPKGEVFQVAKIGAMQAAKQTSSLLPLCHQVPLTHISTDVWFEDGSVWIESTSKAVAQSTGVEMEALTSVSVAALSVYDMLKSFKIGRIVIAQIELVEKHGGTSE
ncbi:putative molybdenum cofactor biosynthesis protein, partial [Opisthorchis viverrini]